MSAKKRADGMHDLKHTKYEVDILRWDEGPKKMVRLKHSCLTSRARVQGFKGIFGVVSFSTFVAFSGAPVLIIYPNKSITLRPLHLVSVHTNDPLIPFFL